MPAIRTTVVDFVKVARASRLFRQAGRMLYICNEDEISSDLYGLNHGHEVRLARSEVPKGKPPAAQTVYGFVLWFYSHRTGE